MGTCFSTVQFRAGRCDGCGDCVIACTQAKSGSSELAHSRIRIMPAAAGGSALVRMFGRIRTVFKEFF